MRKHLLMGAAAAAAMFAATGVFAQDVGTAAEAKAMLEKAVAEVTKDKAAALAKFKAGEGGFKVKDLYPWCANAADGTVTVHPTLTGKNLKEVKDKAGKAFGEEIIKTAKEGTVSEVTYMWPKPAGGDPVQKVTYVTKVGDQVCMVGYYK